MSQFRFLTVDFMERLGKEPDRKIARKFGMKTSEVAAMRIQHSIETFQQQKKWSDEELRMLGTMTDSELARRLGRTKGSVTAARWFYRVEGVYATQTNPHWEDIKKDYESGVMLKEIQNKWGISATSIARAVKKYKWVRQKQASESKHPRSRVYAPNEMRPNWPDVEIRGDWRALISADVRSIWRTFTKPQRRALAAQARAQAAAWAQNPLEMALEREGGK